MSKIFEKLVEIVYNKYEEFAIFETLKVDKENYLSYIFFSPEKKLVLKQPDKVKSFFDSIYNYLFCGYYLAGFFSYELGYFLDYFGEKPNNFEFPLAFFYVFKKPFVFNHKTQKFENEKVVLDFLNRHCVSYKDHKFKIKNFNLNVKFDEYKSSIDKIKCYILSGDTYQVNYTIKAKFDFSGSLLGFYKKLRDAQSVSYSSFIRTKEFSILSFSPELFFRKCDEVITVRPMKGTIDRGRTVYEDRLQAKKLKSSIKNRAENVMIVDLLRNDLGKISPYGGVKVNKLFEIEKYETLFQMTSTIEAKINKTIDFYKLFYAIFPSGSVTGAPKIRTMQIIKELEKEPRNVYTGAIGFFTAEQYAVFNVAIRTVVVDKNNKAEMGIGSGIVADSDAKREFDECKLKSNFLFKQQPKFRLVETILYCSDFYKEIKDFDGLRLNITKDKFKYGFFLLDYHLDRLRSSADYFDFCYDEKEILKKLISLSSSISGCYRVRLLLSKDGKVEIEIYDYNLQNFCSRKKEKIMLVDNKINRDNVFLYHKTTNRRLYNKLYNNFKKSFFDVLFINENNEVTETSRSNVFFKLRNWFFTPPITSGLLNGVFRKYLIDNNKDKIKEKIIKLDDIDNFEKIYVTNGVFGIKEVELIKSKSL
ncbi:MAG: aminodeoxychorismate synthase component I [Endomicrobia bacterium]|nr:aminodeoxychorismate synthase component I [Endomicrobiia bacterium]